MPACKTRTLSTKQLHNFHIPVDNMGSPPTRIIGIIQLKKIQIINSNGHEI